jgi:hypothetical protein
MLTTMAICTGHRAMAQDDALGAHRWVHRLVLVFTPSRSNEASRTFEAALADAAAGIQDRDLVVGWFTSDGGDRLGNDDLAPETVRQWRSRLGIDAEAFVVLLIGKDGGIKARYTEPPALSELFMLIDRMPMRRAELRARGDLSAP